MHKAPPTRLLRARTRFGSSRQAAIKSTAVAAAASASHPRSDGKDREQKGRCIPVDDHQVDEIDGHPKLVELESRQQRERDDEFERQQRRDQRPANQREPEEIQERPAKQEGGPGDPSASVAAMTINAPM